MRKVAVSAAALWASVANAQYTVEILHSPLVPASSSYGAGAGGGQQVGHTNLFLVGPSHALLWDGSAKSLVDLHPAGWDASYAFATDGKRQVGLRERHTGQTGQFATMWSGTAKSWVDLHNAAYFHTAAVSIAGDQQVGIGSVDPSGQVHRALLWRGTSESVVDLNPVGVMASDATATDGIQQVGSILTPLLDPHAALWSGTAKSFVNLHSATYQSTVARGIAGGQQVGIGVFEGNGHAVLWQGSAGSLVDLNPGPNNEWGSEANATNGQIQVGLARTIGSHFHAAMWQGTAASYANLHDYLPAEYSGSGAYSVADGVDEFGNIVGWARHVSTGADHAVLWKPVPEPGTLLILGPLAFYAIIRRSSGKPWAHQRKTSSYLAHSNGRSGILSLRA